MANHSYKNIQHRRQKNKRMTENLDLIIWGRIFKVKHAGLQFFNFLMVDKRWALVKLANWEPLLMKAESSALKKVYTFVSKCKIFSFGSVGIETNYSTIAVTQVLKCWRLLKVFLNSCLWAYELIWLNYLTPVVRF